VGANLLRHLNCEWEMVVGRETFQLAFQARKGGGGGGGANTLRQCFDSEQRWALLGIAQFVLADKLKMMKHRHTLHDLPYVSSNSWQTREEVLVCQVSVPRSG
jgi:hypothetical protein